MPSCVRPPGSTRTTGGPVVGGGPAGLLLATGTSLDVLEMPAAVGRLVCAQLRAAGMAVPVAATPTGRWWFPVTTGGTLPAPLRERTDVVLHTGGAAVLAPPSETPDGWVHWRVAPALSGYRPSPVGPIVAAVLAAADVHEGDRLPVRSPRAVAARPSPAAADRRSAPGTPGSTERTFSPHVGRAHSLRATWRRVAVRRPRGHFSLAAQPHPPSRPGPVVMRTPAPARASIPRGTAGTMESCRPHPPRSAVRTPPALDAAAAARRRRGRAGRRRPRPTRRATCAG